MDGLDVQEAMERIETRENSLKAQRERDKEAVRFFLQCNFRQVFGMDFVHSYLGISFAVVEAVCEELIAEGKVSRPLHTRYVQGVQPYVD